MEIDDFTKIIEKIQTNNQGITEEEVQAYIEKIKDLNVNPQSWDDLMLHKVIISYGYALYFKLEQQDNQTKKQLAAKLNSITEQYYGNLYSIEDSGLQPETIKGSIKKNGKIEVDVKSRSAFASWWSCAFTSGIPAKQMAQVFLLSRFHPAIIGAHIYYYHQQNENIFIFKEANWKFKTHTLPYIKALIEVTAYLLLAAAIVVSIALLINTITPVAIPIVMSFTGQAVQVGSTFWLFQVIVDVRRANLETQKAKNIGINMTALDNALAVKDPAQYSTVIANISQTFVKILEWHQNTEITTEGTSKKMQKVYNGFDTISGTSYIYNLKTTLLNNIPIHLEH
jgi:hypothetical protein